MKHIINSIENLKLILILSGVLLVAFLFFTPKIANRLFEFKRAEVWSNFLEETQRNDSINTQLFWEFRDFYSPGYVQFDQKGLPKPLVKSMKQKIAIPVSVDETTLPYLAFQSPRVQSLDILIKTSSFSAVVNPEVYKGKEILFQNKNGVIYKESKDVIKIAFLASESELKRTNGYFLRWRDYGLIKNKYWLNLSSIQINN